MSGESALEKADGADIVPARGENTYFDDIAGLRSVDILVIADVDANVADISPVGAKDQVARLELVFADPSAHVELGLSGVRETDANLSKDIHRQPRAVERVGPGGRPDIRFAKLRPGKADYLRRSIAGWGGNRHGSWHGGWSRSWG